MVPVILVNAFENSMACCAGSTSGHSLPTEPSHVGPVLTVEGKRRAIE
jgi:hypothetical protein